MLVWNGVGVRAGGMCGDKGWGLQGMQSNSLLQWSP
jgi:hypothetical protein